MTDKPMKNGRKYVDSGFVHDMMDTGTSQHYSVRAHVWPSMKTDLPHNVVVVSSVNSGAVIHASCEPCRASSLGRCSHVVAVLFSILDHLTKHGALITKPCTSQECSWNKCACMKRMYFPAQGSKNILEHSTLETRCASQQYSKCFSLS